MTLGSRRRENTALETQLCRPLGIVSAASSNKLLVLRAMSGSDVHARFRKAVDSLDEGKSLEEALAELRPEMWRGLLPGASRAIAKSALGQLFNDPTPAQTEKLIRETEAALLKLQGKT